MTWLSFFGRPSQMAMQSYPSPMFEYVMGIAALHPSYSGSQRSHETYRASIPDKCRATDSHAPSQPRYIENSSSVRLSPGDSDCSANWLA